MIDDLKYFLLFLYLLGITMTIYTPEVEQWRELESSYFPSEVVDISLCVTKHESNGNPNAKFDEWAYWWSQHPDVTKTSDYPRPPRDTLLGAGVDSQYSVGLKQINVGNLAYNRIAALQGWIPPIKPQNWPFRDWPIDKNLKLNITASRMILSIPENNIAASYLIWKSQGETWTPAWNAEKGKCF